MKNRIIKLCLLVTVLVIFAGETQARRPIRNVQPRKEQQPRKLPAKMRVMLPLL